MKMKKSIIALGSILGIGAVGAGVATSFTACASNNATVLSEMSIIDDYEIRQAQYDFDAFAGMIISPRSEGYIVDEHNGIRRSELNMHEVNEFFTEIINVINEDLKSEHPGSHWYDYEPADWIQCTFQMLSFAITPIYNWFINDTFFMKFLLSDEQRAAATQWWQDMLNNKFRIKDWAKAEFGMRKTIFKGLIEPLLCDSIHIANVTLWDWISLFYGNPWELGIDCEHENDGSEINRDAINLQEIKNFRMPTYKKYDWSQVGVGDILYSANGFSIGDVNSGHMGIITGWKTDVNGIRYLQCIEPDQYGVQYCAIDDERIDNDNLSILHIDNATDLQRLQAVAFATAQLGKDYYLPLFMTMSTDLNSPSWYCSELAWASYKSTGLDIQNHEWIDTIGCEPGATPHNIYHYEHTKILIQNEAGII